MPLPPQTPASRRPGRIPGARAGLVRGDVPFASATGDHVHVLTSPTPSPLRFAAARPANVGAEFISGDCRA